MVTELHDPHLVTAPHITAPRAHHYYLLHAACQDLGEWKSCKFPPRTRPSPVFLSCFPEGRPWGRPAALLPEADSLVCFDWGEKEPWSHRSQTDMRGKWSDLRSRRQAVCLGVGLLGVGLHHLRAFLVSSTAPFYHLHAHQFCLDPAAIVFPSPMNG